MWSSGPAAEEAGSDACGEVKIESGGSGLVNERRFCEGGFYGDDK